MGSEVATAIKPSTLADPVLSSVLIPPTGNEPAPDEKSAHKVHYGASAFWGSWVIRMAGRVK
jgi:hypothetical protein